MSALIPAVASTVGPKLAANYGKLLLKYGRLNKAQVAADIATAVNIGKKMARSAKRMKFTQARRGAKRKRASAAQRRARKFKLIGNERGSTTSKRDELTVQTNGEALRVDMSTRTLYHELLNHPPKSSNASSVSTRLKDKCFIKGIKFCMEVTNNKNDQLYFNYAILALKQRQGALIQVPLPTSLPLDFFRNFNGNKRSCDFDDIQLDSNDYRCRPINQDKYHIFAHRRIRFVKNNSNFCPTRAIDRYIKVNRQFNYSEEEGSEVVNQPLYLVYWCDTANKDANTTIQTNAAYFNARMITYFKDPPTD